MTNEHQVLDNIALIHQILKRYTINENDREDIISVGTIGLIKAANTYKADKGVKFSTYAANCIVNEICMFFRKQRKNHNTKIEISLYAPIADDLYLMDTMYDGEDFEEICIRNVQIQQMLKSLDNLTEKERNIIRWGYGIGCRKRTQREIAEYLGVSQAHISRYTSQILKKLKRQIKNF